MTGGETSTDLHSISDLESRLGAGLIEEVIQVAEGEHKLVDVMAEAKV
jgi:NADH dehydrogenase (ubiquinone) 1 alpha subcomplex subunit 5